MCVDYLKRIFSAGLLLVLGVYFLQKKSRKLNQTELYLLAPYFNNQLLNNAEIVEGDAPFWLQKKMAGVVIGRMIFLRKPLLLSDLPLKNLPLQSPQIVAQTYLNDIEILAHELVHAAQYAAGMTIFKYLWASRHGYYQNPYELEAYAKAAQIKKSYQEGLFKNVPIKNR